MIKCTGFFRNKTKSLLGMAKAVAERHGGEVPRTMDELVELPGVGTKDGERRPRQRVRQERRRRRRHARRRASASDSASRSNTDPVKIEQDLMKLFPREHWTMLVASPDRARPSDLRGAPPEVRVMLLSTTFAHRREYRKRSLTLDAMVRAPAGAPPPIVLAACRSSPLPDAASSSPRRSRVERRARIAGSTGRTGDCAEALRRAALQARPRRRSTSRARRDEARAVAEPCRAAHCARTGAPR